MVYDNRGGDPACGGRPFDSETRGMQQPLPNGNVLTIEPHGGRVLEVTRDGELAWEYFNVLDGPPATRVGVVTQAERFPIESLPFLGEVR